jgi:cytochrome c5
MLMTSRTATLLFIAVPVVAVLTALPSVAQDTSSFKSVHITLPTDERVLPDGPGADVANNNCASCHSAGMILNQPTLPRSAWESEVNKMRNVFKAPVSAQDVSTIVEYLTRMQGSE